MTALWGVLAAMAILWPDRLAGWFDGIPLDRRPEAIAVGVIVPMLWWYAPRFLTTRFARTCILLLLVSRIAAAATLTQQGWCVRFEPARPYVKEQTGAPHAWDLRADWLAADPACSAIMTRAYGSLEEFPAWFFNLPPPDESWPAPADRPPAATTRLTLRGFLNPATAGTLTFATTPDLHASLSVDGGERVAEAALTPGAHLIALDATLTGENWRLVPLWNGGAMRWAMTTIRRPSALDLAVGGWARWIPTIVAILFGVGWMAWAVRTTADPALVVWTLGASFTIGGLIVAGRDHWARIAVAMLALSAAVPLHRRFRNLRGAFVAIGVPWMAFVVACASPAIGRFVIYDVGHDYWMYQRFAYRIVMQGHWLEGGTATFWFQPFYRWIVGALHVIFGDSSVGEWFWDGACLLAIALLAFELTRRISGFAWGLVAGVLPLAIFVIGTPQYLIGRGLGEISSAGFLAAASLLAMRSRHGQTRSAFAAGVLATLAFLTRLNNLPMALGTSVFAYRRRTWGPAAIVVATIAAGAMLLALRTWYFTGEFSLFAGTQRNLLAIWQPGISIRTGLERTLESVLMMLTVNDPPRFDPLAIPVLLGALAAVAALVSRTMQRVVPLPASLFFLCGIAGAFVARGSAYPGRFSLHLLGVTCALSICAVSAVVARITARDVS